MLKQRVLTALVLIAVLVPALWAPSLLPFVGLLVLLMAIAQWEWGRLHGVDGIWGLGGALAWGLGSTVLLALGFPFSIDGRRDAGVADWLGLSAQFMCLVWLSVVLVWALWAVAAWRTGPEGWARLSRGLRLVLGAAVIAASFFAMLDARLLGLDFFMSVLCLVWTADIAAYFGGRAFGRRRLAPQISPGKTWEGAWSGAISVFFLAVAWVSVEQTYGVEPSSVFGVVLHKWGWLGGGLALLMLTSYSIMGDLLESLVKRSVGVKDSSQLLPGHGGVLDRIDALLPVFPLAVALLRL